MDLFLIRTWPSSAYAVHGVVSTRRGPAYVVSICNPKVWQ